jgi:ABC-type multidrug transport system fused ATPase/permease subunit/pSer/pThr/pTyr-binding forkhead associated (FHA) protein
MGFLFRFLYRNLKGYRPLVLLAILVSFADVAVTILAALPLKYIPAKLQSATNPKNDPDAIWSGFVTFFDKLANQPVSNGVHSVVGVILFSASLLIAATILDAILGYLDLYLAAFIGQNLTARLRKRLFEQIQRLSLDWHGKQKKGDIVQRVTGNVTDIEKFVTDGLVDLLTSILTILGVAAVMVANSVPYSILSLVIVPPLALVVFSYTASIKAAAKKTAKANAEVADVAVEDVGAITVIKAFDLVERETDRFNKYADKTRKAGLRAGSLQAQFTPLVTVLVGIATAIIIGIGAYVAANNTFSFIVTIKAGTLNLGIVILFITLLGKLFQPMKDLSKLTNVMNGASAGAERIQDILDQAPEVIETKVPYVGPQTLRGEITFEQVTFGYTPEKLILKGINLHIPAGRKVALVGLSGGGKTTLVKLIPRFYEVTGGVVKLDGRDTREYPLSLLRQNVSMVLQESVMFEGTILENLKIGRPNATMEEVVRATKQAQIHDTIMSWQEGYGTLVRNQGKNFSGGQRQRLAIARALLSDAHILVLDEPTAALDVEAELEVMKALDTLVVGRTVLMISHRLSTLGKVDEIIVLKEGLIVEHGTYKELKNRPNGIFADLLGKQKQYDVDYVGGSMIIPQAELVRLVKQKQSPVLQEREVPMRELVPTNGQDNGRDIRRKARVAVEVDGRMTGEFELDKPELRIGRIAANDIHIPSERVSRLHARIRWANGGWVIEDAQSLNGLSYQGELTDHHRLANGDRIYLAPKVVLIYREDRAPVAMSSRPSKPESLPLRVHPSSTPLAPMLSPLPQAQIVIEVDGRVLVTRPLDKETLMVGRLPGNDVQISSTLVSGQHAMLMRQNGKWLIIDRGSRNGLTYQGQRVERHTLSKGDRIYLAPTVVLRFEQI